MKNKLIGIFITTVIGGTLVIACNSGTETPQATPEAQQPAAVTQPANPAAEPEAAVESQPPVEAEKQASSAAEPKTEPLADAEAPAAPETADSPAAAASTAIDDVVAVDASAVVAEKFTATTGLADFAAYRLNFNTSFDGSKNGAPTSGTLGGLFEVTAEPPAQHWRLNMAGDAFAELALLGGKMEMYDIGDTIYLQNPGDESFIGMPAMLVENMLPTDMVNPEDSIELPATATVQPGQETINGIATRRYTFGKDDLASDSSSFDSVAGTVWVAVDGNYVVKYEATISGKFDNLVAGDMTLLDEGTLTMMYEISDANGDFTISPPAGAQQIDLSKLFN